MGEEQGKLELSKGCAWGERNLSSDFRELLDCDLG